ncbi:diguanylate cyclase [Rhodanobacter sp. AS-Z3]|uniref:diguanylate cyclase domain-containing protein n=1 Tax=Rhodanobacter sp. AS-Z3 TaxID=3031330 RepID=UPI00247A7F01|nr:diguanylate cyclase [Rhodanobacter sp. AS-Z3]WEN16700.1 diguanylate cyclase [Rhodanobacter sp. AS-Z3]
MTSKEKTRAELRERFYRSVAETLSLLHEMPDGDRQEIMVTIAGILASTMGLPLVWIGRREPGRDAVDIMAAAGIATEYVKKLHISANEADPGGGGPVGKALRQGSARADPVSAPGFGPWLAAAKQYGFGSCIVAASKTRDLGQLVLVAYAGENGPSLNVELLEWAQRLADEIGRFWDQHELQQRSLRMSRYRDAQRTIQRALLEQPDPHAVYQVLAKALVDMAGAAWAEVFVPEDATGLLRRSALFGPSMDIVRDLPCPRQYDDDPSVMTPTLAFMRRMPMIRRRPAVFPESMEPWRRKVFEKVGAIGCWPLFALSAGDLAASREPVGVLSVATVEIDAFDGEMCRLLDEIVDAAGLALKQHAQRQALQREQERQSYLALHDDLTGLPNRRALDQYLDTMLVDARQHGSRMAIGLLDLDDLKPVNDRYGHAVGDRLLVEVANRLRKVLRAKDYVARFGGDEFVLVFENIQQEADIEWLLDRAGEILLRPVWMDGLALPMGASLGIALYSADAPASGEQLLRRADQAMYQIKARKNFRTRWWAMAQADGTLESAQDSDASLSAYDDQAAGLLKTCCVVWESQLPDVVESYVDGLLRHDGIASMLRALPEAEMTVLKSRVMHHMLCLLRPDVDFAYHRSRAIRAGMFHAACGLDEVWMLEAVDLLRERLAIQLRVVSHHERRAQTIVLQRLGMERQWQLESMREVQRHRVALLARLNALAWSADSYLKLAQAVVDIMASHGEICASAVGRPDASGEWTYEFIAGDPIAGYLRAVSAGTAPSIHIDADSVGGGNPNVRAWQTSTIQRCVHFGSDPATVAWRDIAAKVGVVSSVAIPLCPVPQQPAAVLTLYSPYLGGLRSDDQQAFVEQIKTVLDLALARLAPPRAGTELLPFFVRERWRTMVGTDALQMHYQPLLRLADGKVVEFEALARLRDVDGKWLAPGYFLPVLDTNELITLFHQGLSQATACRARMLQLGHALDMSVNVPAAALEDSRYAEVAAAVVETSGCPPHALLLEILESPMGTEHAAWLDAPGMQSLRALGVRLVEDDLGAGYSSLIRLRQWPFDRIKIDQAIVFQARQDPLGTLRFIRQLIRIGHDLQLEVVVEGLESLDLVEAAAILGADFGQGYALARPMPASALPAWLDGFSYELHGNSPRTALGALAGELRWEEQFIALPPEPAFWARHANVACDPGEYLHVTKLSAALDASHQAMHNAAMAGPQDPGYREQRQAFLALLVEHVLGAGSF